jgi:hypothetical protein
VLDVSGDRAVVRAESGARSDTIAVLDVADPRLPVELARFTPREHMYVYLARLHGEQLFICGTYGLGGSELLIFSVSDINEPRFLGEFNLSYIAGDIGFVYDHAYFALTSSIGDADDGSPGTVLVIDVSDPSDPQIASRMLFPRSVNRVEMVGRYAYLLTGDYSATDSSGLVAMSTYRPSSPHVSEFVSLDGRPLELVVDEPTILVAVADHYTRDLWGWALPPSGSVRVIDRAYSEEVGRIPIGSPAWSMVLEDGMLWVGAEYTGLWAWHRND